MIGYVGLELVINLDRRPDRFARFCREVDSVDGWPFHAPVRFSATDGSREHAPDWWRGTTGAYGCWLSHLRAIRQADTLRADSVLILEDDAFFCPGFAEHYRRFSASVPDDWEQVYLGGQFPPDTQAIIQVAPGVLSPSAVIRTHAYLLRDTAYHRLIALLSDANSIKCIDRWHVDGMYRALHEAGMLRVYAPSRWLVGQEEGESDVFAGDVHGPRYWNLEVV